MLIQIAFFVFYLLALAPLSASSEDMQIPQNLETKLSPINLPGEMLKGNVADFFVAFDKILREKAGARLRIEYGADVGVSMAQILSEPIRDVVGITDEKQSSNPFATSGQGEKNLSAHNAIYWIAVRCSPCKVTYEKNVISISIRDEWNEPTCRRRRLKTACLKTQVGPD